MSAIDWIVLIITLLAVIGYGLYKSKSEKTLDGYFKSSNSMSWILILLSIMGTQASAITFLSAPGQAYTDGMRFVQYYFAIFVDVIFTQLQAVVEVLRYACGHSFFLK